MSQSKDNGNGRGTMYETDPFFDGPQDMPPQGGGADVPPEKGEKTPLSKGGEDAKRKGAGKKVLAVVLSVAALAIAFLWGIYCSRFFYDAGLKSLLWFKERVQSEYYEEVSDEEFWQAAIDGVEASLDPYSQYFTSDEYDEKGKHKTNIRKMRDL